MQVTGCLLHIGTRMMIAFITGSHAGILCSKINYCTFRKPMGFNVKSFLEGLAAGVVTMLLLIIITLIIKRW